MKIGIDARPLSYQLTGIGIYLKCLLDEIARIDHKNNYYLISNGPINYKLKNSNWIKIEGKFKNKFVSTIWTQVKVPFIVSKLNIDIYWGTRHQLPMGLSKKVKTLLTIHDIVHCKYPGTMTYSNLLAERFFMKLSIARSDCITADSFSTQQDIYSYYKVNSKKVHLVYPGTPDLLQTDQIAHSDSYNFSYKYFLFVGTLDPRKNFKRIVKAFEMTNPEKTKVHLVIVGDKGWKNKSFLKTLKTHPCINYIHLTGYVSKEYLILLYKKALCLLFPSIYEGFGFPILEAMSFGTPVITSNISAMKEVASDAALLVDPYNLHEITIAMNKIIQNKCLRKKLIKKGYQRADSFSWNRCANNIIKLFNMVANNESVANI